MYYYLKVIFAMYGKNDNAKEFTEGNRLLVTLGAIALILMFSLSAFI
jgi:hypothetical protein